MSEEKKAAGLPSPSRINIEYDPDTAIFNLTSNVMDEVITTGMLHLALKKLSEKYRMDELKEIYNKARTEVIPSTKFEIQ